MTRIAKAAMVLSFGLAATSAFAQDFCNATHPETGTTYNQNKKDSFTNGIGYEIWFSGGSNSATFYDDGSLKCSFSNTNDYLCRSGKAYDSDKTYDQLGHLYADFSVTKSNISGVQYSYIGIYGWSVDPLIEFYIVDDWAMTSDDAPGSWMGPTLGTITVNGATYDIYKHEQKDQPAITGGNTTFMQYFSIRRSRRSCGTIDITAHFDAWKKLNLELGKMYQVQVMGEAGNENGGVSGSFDFKYAKVYVGNATTASSTSSASVASSASVTPGNAYSSASVPGKVEFENYDIDGYGNASSEKASYADASKRPDDNVSVINVGSGNGVGAIQPNQWMEYTVNVTGTGKYFLTVSAAKGDEGNSGITFQVDGTDWGSVTVVGEKDETWSNYKEYKTASSAQLTAGTHVIRAVFDGYVNVDYFELTADGELVISSSASEAVNSSASVAGNSSASASGDKTALVSDIRMLVDGRDMQVFDLQGKYLGKMNVKNAGSVAEALKSTFKQSGVYLVKQGSYIQRISVK